MSVVDLIVHVVADLPDALYETISVHKLYVLMLNYSNCTISTG